MSINKGEKVKKLFCVLVMLTFALGGSVFAENVFLLRISQNEDVLVQVNSSMEPMTNKCKKGAMLNQNIIGPVQEGAVFLLVDDIEPKTKIFGLRSILFEYEQPTLQSTRRFTVTANDRRIALVYDATDIYASSEENMQEYKKAGTFEKIIRSLLKNAIKEYQGTEWENALNAELEEWK